MVRHGLHRCLYASAVALLLCQPILGYVSSVTQRTTKIIANAVFDDPPSSKRLEPTLSEELRTRPQGYNVCQRFEKYNVTRRTIRLIETYEEKPRFCLRNIHLTCYDTIKHATPDSFSEVIEKKKIIYDCCPGTILVRSRFGILSCKKDIRPQPRAHREPPPRPQFPEYIS